MPRFEVVVEVALTVSAVNPTQAVHTAEAVLKERLGQAWTEAQPVVGEVKCTEADSTEPIEEEEDEEEEEDNDDEEDEEEEEEKDIPPSCVGEFDSEDGGCLSCDLKEKCKEETAKDK